MQQARLCQICLKKEAAYHFIEIVDGEPRDINFCEDCAREQVKGQPSLPNFLATLIKKSAKRVAKMSKLVCPRCGASYLDFQEHRRLGCAQDYEAFGESMMELLEKIHGETRHLGKVPAGADGRAARQAELRRLRQALRRAVEQEHYEQAALLRDRIQQMEETCRGAR
jgi:protein arginine kinase activator